MFKKSRLPLIATIAICTSVLLGCKTTAPKNEAATIKIAGSTSLAPLIKTLKQDYQTKNSGVTIEVQETGSSAGITATLEGAANVGMSSRDLKPTEKEKGLKEIVICLDGIAIVVNKQNPISNLTKDEITKIYTGEINNWSQLGGEDKEIIVVSREEGSGTRGAFEELLNLEKQFEKDGKTLKQSLVTQNALFENNTGAVKTNVAQTKEAIGYISLGAMDESVVAIKIDGAQCNEQNVKNKSYTVARPFLLCTVGEVPESAQQFLDYILSDEGQKIVTASGYVSIR